MRVLLSLGIVALSLFFSNDSGQAQSTDRTPRFEVGAQFTSLTVNPHSPICFAVCLVDEHRRYTEPGVGIRFTYNLTNHIGLEAEANAFPKEYPGYTHTLLGLNGRNAQAQFGVKAGKRFRKFGFFGKARPGFVSFSKVSYVASTSDITFGGRQFTVGQFGEKPRKFFSTDLGGVVEFYPSRRVVTRVDLGDTIVRYGEIFVPGFSLSNAIQSIPAETRHNFQLSLGVGFRFK